MNETESGIVSIDRRSIHKPPEAAAPMETPDIAPAPETPAADDGGHSDTPDGALAMVTLTITFDPLKDKVELGVEPKELTGDRKLIYSIMEGAKEAMHVRAVVEHLQAMQKRPRSPSGAPLPLKGRRRRK